MAAVKKKVKDPVPALRAELNKVKKQLSGKSPVKLLASQVTAGTIAADGVVAGNLAADSVDAGALQVDSVTARSIAASSITTDELAAGSVTATTIAAGTITATEIAAGTITGDRIAAGTLTATNIQAGTITATQISAGTITSTQIQAGSINADRIYAGSVQAQLIQTNNLAAGSITAGVIAANTITATQMAASSVTTTVLAADSVTAAKIAAGTITAAKIAAGTITANEIASHTITAAVIAAGTITATEIATATITSSLITAGTIVAANIASGTITGSLIASATIAGTNLVAGTITATQIAAGTITGTQIAATAIDGMTITGATVQTASSGARIVMNTGGITAYNGSGVAQLNFDTSTGNLTLSGTVTANSSSVVPTTVLSGTLTTTQIGTGSVTSTNILDGTIASGDVGSRVLAADRIVANSLTTSEIQSAGVNADRLVANSITAGQIASGTITATQIQAGSITGDRFTATAIDAMTITGATFRTGSSSPKLQMDSTGIFATDTAGTTRMQVNTSGLLFTIADGGNTGQRAQGTSGALTPVLAAVDFQVGGQSFVSGSLWTETTIVSTARQGVVYLVAGSNGLGGNRNSQSVVVEAQNNSQRSGASISVGADQTIGSVTATVGNATDGQFSATLLNTSGNTQLPGTLTAGNYGSLSGTMTGSWSKVFGFAGSYPTMILKSTISGPKYAACAYDATSGWSFWVNGTSDDVSGTGTQTMILTNGGVVLPMNGISTGTGSSSLLGSAVGNNTSQQVYVKTAGSQQGAILANCDSNVFAGDAQINVVGKNDATTYTFYRAQNSTGTRFYVRGDGVLFSSSTSVSSVSDAVLKKNIKSLDVEDALNKIRGLRAVEFDWNHLAANEGHDVGFIAQEVEHVVPAAVDEFMSGGHNDPKYKTVSQGDFIPYIIGAVQQVDTEQARDRRRTDALANTLRALADDLEDAVGGAKGKLLAGRLRDRLSLELELAAL